MYYSFVSIIVCKLLVFVKYRGSTTTRSYIPWYKHKIRVSEYQSIRVSEYETEKSKVKVSFFYNTSL